MGAVILRSLLQMGAGVLVSHGIEQSCALSVLDAVQPALLAGGVWFVSVVWSVFEKKAIQDKASK